LERAPESAEAHANLGNALRLAHRNDEALLSLQRALQICPDHPLALLNLGVVLAHQRRVEEATDCFRAAIRRKPEFATAHHNLGIQLLLQGNWEEGWKEYAWRWRCSEFAPRIFRQPLWNGQPLPGGTILLHTEQGMGDTILFIRYAALVKQRVDRVIVQCPACMIPLLSHCAGIDQLVPEDGELPPFDVYAPLLNVPGLVGSVPGNVPADVPYLFADCDRVAWYRDRLMAENAFKVGIVWRGNPNYITDAQRSARLQDFEPVARVPGVRLFCLQKDATAEEWQVMRGRVPLADPGAPAPVAAGAFVNTAAAMQQMDLIISIDSAPAHLAGALARPVWVALAYAADWRWLRDREDTVWYPTMRLFRQHRPGDWGGVFSRMADQLPAQMAISRRSGQVPPHEK
ncbi:MAG: tetratricopeptide repeat protein, partial [Pirellulaceae bacterium]